MKNGIFSEVYSKELVELEIDEHMSVMYNCVQSAKKIGTVKDLYEVRALISKSLTKVLDILKNNDFTFAAVKINDFFTKAAKNGVDTEYGLCCMVNELYCLLFHYKNPKLLKMLKFLKKC